jgi:hypothetical protein
MFAATDLSGVTLAPNESRTISVHFTPTARGSQSATLSIDSNDPRSPAQVPLAGTGVAPVLRISPTAVDFGKEPVDLSGSLAVLLQNTGDAPLLVRGVSFTGPNASEFALASTLNSGETLQPGDITLVDIRFSPAATGGRSASLVIDSDSLSIVSPVQLAGTGTEPLLRLSNDALIFGIQPAGGGVSTQTLVLTNNGDAPLVISGLALAGPDAPRFAIVSDSGEKSLDPGASRTVVLSFSSASIASVRGPARIAAARIASASYMATLTIGHNDPHPGSPHQVTLTAAAVPGAPSNLTASPAGYGKIRLSWTDNSTTETAMEVFRQVGAGSFTRIAVLAPNTTSYTDYNAAGSTAYTYQVRAANDYWASAFSNPASIATPFPPAAPTGLSATQVGNRVNLTWTVNSSNETALEVYRQSGSGSLALLAVLAPKSMHYTDMNVSGAAAYTYQVRAANDYWASTYTNPANVTTALPPAPPTGLKAIGYSYNKVTLAWTDNSTNETAFEIYRKTGSGGYVLVGVVAPNTTLFVDTTASPATSFTYQVRAANDFFASAYTNPVSVTTVQAPPAAPSGLTAMVVSATEIDLTWTDNRTNETALEVYRQTSSGAYTLLAVLPPGSAGFADMGVAAKTGYSYRVRSANDAWASAYTNVASASTP